MLIKAFDYLTTLQTIESEVMDAVRRVLHSGRLIHGAETEGFEAEFGEWVGAPHVIGVTSGTAAIEVALRAVGVGIGDEVVTVSNTCAPTVSAIRATGAHPVFVDIDPATLMMDVNLVASALTERTRCVVPVHLFGRAVDMTPLVELASAHDIPVVEDCAQATGTSYRGRHVGTIGTVGCFSFYPTKNLGAYGDAGAVVTGDASVAERARRIRMYGYGDEAIALIEGTNARISEIQAAILRVKLELLDGWLAKRRELAQAYDRLLGDSALATPGGQEGVVPSHHLYVVRCPDRDRVEQRLSDADIGYGIHYPTPVHLMPAYAFLGGAGLDLPVTTRASSEILSLPLHESLTQRDVETVANTIR